MLLVLEREIRLLCHNARFGKIHMWFKQHIVGVYLYDPLDLLPEIWR